MKLTEKERDKIRQFAVNNYTCNGISYDELLRAEQGENIEVVLWEPFQYHDLTQVLDLVNDMIASTEDLIVNLHK